MKNSTLLRRLAGLGGEVRLGRDQVVIRLPDPKILRLLARTALIAAFFIFFPWIQTAIRSTTAVGPPRSDADEIAAFLADLKSFRLLNPTGHAVFLGECGSYLPILIQNRIDPVSADRTSEIADLTLDFVFADESATDFDFTDRTLKIAGIVAVRLPTDPAARFALPPNYRIVYISHSAVALRKTGAGPSGGRSSRRLLSVPTSKKEALDGLEDVVLEPPTKRKERRRTRYLPDLMGDSLAAYPRRVFVDVGAAGRAGSEGWFERHYPKRNRDFEIIRVEVVGGKEAAATVGGGMTEWLKRNVKEEEYVVMKAEAEVVEEMVKGKAINLVDELFLECKNQWQKGKKGGVKSRRAYWECLSLYGKLKDEGVAVHQWWD